MVNTEFKVIRLSLDAEPAMWEQQLNDAAGQGFDWVHAVPGADGGTYVVMRRVPAGQGRIVPL